MISNNGLSPEFATRDNPSIAETLKVRATLDALDAELMRCGALSDPAVFAARRALGKVVGCLTESYEQRRVIGITARTFPPYGENGALQTPPPRTSSETDQ